MFLCSNKKHLSCLLIVLSLIYNITESHNLVFSNVFKSPLLLINTGWSSSSYSNIHTYSFLFLFLTFIFLFSLQISLALFSNSIYLILMHNPYFSQIYRLFYDISYILFDFYTFTHHNSSIFHYFYSSMISSYSLMHL